MDFRTSRVVPTPEHIAELERLGDRIAELSAHLDAATASLLDLIRDFDQRGGWGNGFRSCAEWLSWRVGLDLGAARERVRVAHALGTLPRLAQALARGELSYAKVRALTRVATPETEERLLVVGRAGTASHVERIVRGWRAVDRRVELLETAKRHATRALHVYQDDDGMVIIRGRLGPEEGAVFMQALAAAREALYQRARQEARDADGEAEASAAGASPDGESTQRSDRVSAETRRSDPLLTGSRPIPPQTPMEQQQADALALLAETALHRGIDPGAPGERYQVVVHVDAAVLADAEAPGQVLLEDGVRVSAETSQRLACDASRVVMRHGPDGSVVEVGARTRTIPPAIRRALQHRDRGCRFPGCRGRFTQGHHIRHWAHGGPTTLSNLTLLCRRHHQAVHEEGYQVERTAGGELVFHDVQGQVIPDVPESAALPEDPYELIRKRNEAAGLEIHARTAMPSWSGDRLDLGYAIDVLHPRVAGPIFA
jgi:hypothetical protein